MKVTKLGHCCLLIEEAGVRVLTDPGTFSTKQDEVTGIDLVLITHEHADHLHIDSLKKVIANNPTAKVITNSAVGKILDQEKIAYTVVEDGGKFSHGDVTIEGCGTEHGYIYKTVKAVMNTGYLVNNKLFYPGDALYDPKRPVEVLALPVVAPWLKISEAIDYAKALKPKACFPVHDGALRPDRAGFVPRVMGDALASTEIRFVPMAEGSVQEF